MRVETTIVSVHFEDGAKVNEAICCFTLDARQSYAQTAGRGHLARIRPAEGAQRDVRRYSDRRKGATTQSTSIMPKPRPIF